MFGPESGDNVYFEAKMKVGVKLAGELNYLLLDEMMFKTSFDMEVKHEVIYANFKSMTVTQAGDPANRSEPIYNPIGMNAEEYAEFWSYVDMRMERWLSFFNNEVFGAGVPLPYQNLQFLTKLTFHPRALIVVMDLFYHV